MKGSERRILHVDLEAFFVSVERSLDASLRGRPVIIGGDASSSGVVAVASEEARQLGVRPGQTLSVARKLCPDGAFRPGDFEAYARSSDEVTQILLLASRRVERPSSDEAYVDLTTESPLSPNPVTAAETVKDEIQRRLGLDASLGLAKTRLAARVASRFARPRGFLVLLPGYEASFLARQPISILDDLPPHLEKALENAGFQTLGDLTDGDPSALASAVGAVAAEGLRRAARGDEPEVSVSAPPSIIQEDAILRDPRSDRATLDAVLSGLASRAFRRLRPFGLGTGAVSLEVRRSGPPLRRSRQIHPGIFDEETAVAVTRSLGAQILTSAAGVKSVHLRLSRLGPQTEAPLFPVLAGGRV